MGLSREATSQRTTCESAGLPVQPMYCSLPKPVTTIGSFRVPVCLSELFLRCWGGLRLGLAWAGRTPSAGIQGPHVEDIHSLHLAQNLQPLETGRLLEIGGHGTRLTAGREEVVFGGDVYREPHPH